MEINQKTVVSMGLVIAVGGLVFMSGAYWEKVQRLEGLGLDKQLAQIRTDLALIKQRLDIVPRPTSVAVPQLQLPAQPQ